MSKKTYDFPYKKFPSTNQSLEDMVGDSKWLIDIDKLPKFREMFQFPYSVEEVQKSIIPNQSFWEGLSWEGKMSLAFYRPDPKTENYHAALYHPEIEIAVPLCSHTMNYIEKGDIEPVDNTNLKACSTCMDAGKLLANPDSFKINPSNLNQIYLISWIGGKIGLKVPRKLWDEARRNLFARETEFETEEDRKAYVLNYFPAYDVISHSGARAIPFEE